MIGERIGPYRVERELGSGGMGVVYLAFDERLRRNVAIKSIHPGKEVSPKRRERLLREARAAAQLTHPSIAQIYDILSIDGRDFIVMEYVDGRTLTQLLGPKPVDLREAVDISRQIAEGLHAAHAQGIVHRDLKPENIIITPSGDVKILDFGLAKTLDPESPEVSLTADGVVLGTSSAMSPEQAKGKPVDQRSDLFSLGSLMYTMVTGKHPFQGANPLETMQRIVRHRPPLPSRLNKDVPEELALLIESLLEKDPRERPSSALEVALALEEIASFWKTMTTDHGSISRITRHARRRRFLRYRWLFVTLAIAGLLVAGAAARWWTRRPRPPRIVAVVAPEVTASGNPGRAGMLATAARAAALETIAHLRGLATPATREVDAAGHDPKRVARATGASEVLETALAQHGATIQVSLQRIDGRSGKVLASRAFTVPADDLSLLSEGIAAHLRQSYPGFEPRTRGMAAPPSPQAFAAYVQLLMESQDPPKGVGSKQIIDKLDALRQANPTFLAPYLTEARLLRLLPQALTDRRYFDRARELLSRAWTLSPEDPRIAAEAIRVELDAGNLKAANTALQRLKRISPGSPQALALRAWFLQRSGKTDEALTLLHRLVKVYPSVANFEELAEVELHSGHVDAARRALHDGLALDPNRLWLKGKLAQLELLNGDPEVAEKLYATIAARFKDPIIQSNLGTALLLQNKTAKALRAFQTAHALNPRDPVAVLSIADCLGMLGRAKEARSFYRTALKLAVPLKSSDPRTYFGIVSQGLAHLGKLREAVQAVQSEIRIAPNEAQTYFDAALVYAILGDRTTTVVYAERAVQLGLNPRWLELPYFKSLRADPGFAALLNGSGTSSGQS
ncbi:MAG: protein kinase [Acidobacteria bacterium]|nr:protein kinase [Acidobacteriota bacterium]